jgi:epoxyqueuosine reductase QueG
MMPGFDWERTRSELLAQGALQVAAGDIREIRDDFELARMQDLSGLDYAVSLVFPLPSEVLAGIEDGPTLLYKHAYAQVNYLMDRTALMLALGLQAAGYRALPVAASQIISWEPLKAHVNHRQVAVHLGHGWYGRNNLLVTPRRGAQVRLVSVLTDAEVTEPGPWAERRGQSGCGPCRRCGSVCPADAIHDGPADFDLPACAAKTKEFEKRRGIGQRICGVCVRACGPVAGGHERA